MHLDFDDESVIPRSRNWYGRTYITDTLIEHGPPRKAQLRIKVSSRDPLEQWGLGAIVFELWCIKKGVSCETQNQ